MSRPRPSRRGPYSSPLAQGPTEALHGVPPDVYRHDRHRVVPPADLGRDGQPRGHASGARLPRQAIVVACGFDARTVAAWGARAGRQGQAVQEHLVERLRDLGQVPADAIRVKTPGGLVWMALAMMVKTRLWLAGEVSAPRDRPLIRRLLERVRRGAAPAPLWRCTDGLSAYVRARRETCRDPVRTGAPGRPRRHPWRHPTSRRS